MSTAALRAGNAVGFFSAEMDAKSILKRMISDWGSVDFKRLQSGVMGKGDFASIEEAFRQIVDSRLFINDRPCISLYDLVSSARQMRRKEAIGVLFIDYLSLVTNERRDIPRHEQVAEISRTLKGLARELDIPIVVLSQLTREAQGERPKLSQLRDSGAVEQDADMVILLHALGFTDESRTELKINLIVEKNRNGATGEISMVFKPQVMRFGESDQTWYVKGAK
jgi:replicative DNA helicase